MNPSRKNWIKQRVIDLITRRDHSEYELKTKLKKYLSELELQWAIGFAKQFRLIPQTEEENQLLAQKVVENYQRKKQGSLKITHQLKKKRLPTPKIDLNKEFNLALELITLRCSKSQKALTKDKLFRYLISRGFNPSIALKALSKIDTKESHEIDH